MTRADQRVLAVGAAWLAVVGSAVWFSGVAGWRGGGAIALVTVAGGAVAAATLAARGTDANRMWLLTLAVLGIVAAAWMIDVAPLSPGRLAADLDQFRLPFYTKVSEHRAGHSWCRPACPSVRRVYEAPLTSLSLPKDTVAVSASYLHLLPDLKTVLQARSASGFQAEGARTTIVERAERHGDRLRVTVELRSHRGRRHKVPPPVTSR